MLKRPEDVWPVDKDYVEGYESLVRVGREVAADSDVILVGIVRNALPHLENTLRLVDELRGGFRSLNVFLYENDSIDGTKSILTAWATTRPWVTVRMEDLGLPDERGFQESRMDRLAAARNICFDFVMQSAKQTAFTIVLDLDPEHGFSVDGVFNSIACLAGKLTEPSVLEAGGMASFSLYARTEDGQEVPAIAHYDAFAARPNWWRDRRHEIGMGWFSMLLYPVGSPPVAFNSAFGGLAVYTTRAFLAGGYGGGDCEHVVHHRKMRKAGYQMFLNPGCRYVAIWQ